MGRCQQKQLNTLAEQLTNAEFQVNGKSTFKKEEFVTAGGIDLKKLISKLWKDKVLPNLFCWQKFLISMR